ncbi:hypothetical protein ABZX51_010182 [Aspergillus tubingensis]
MRTNVLRIYPLFTHGGPGGPGGGGGPSGPSSPQQSQQHSQHSKQQTPAQLNYRLLLHHHRGSAAAWTLQCAGLVSTLADLTDDFAYRLFSDDVLHGGTGRASRLLHRQGLRVPFAFGHGLGGPQPRH